jgi:hypothetical protein
MAFAVVEAMVFVICAPDITVVVAIATPQLAGIVDDATLNLELNKFVDDAQVENMFVVVAWDVVDRRIVRASIVDEEFPIIESTVRRLVVAL